MESILAFFIIIIVILAFSSVLPLSTQKAQIPQPQEGLSEVQTETPKSETQKTVSQVKPIIKPVIKPQEIKPTISINTYIVSGPKKGEVIGETNQVTFEFEAKVFPQETQGRITFETKIEGFDEKWIATRSKKRTITLFSGPKEYTFLVRARIGNIVDLTPAKTTFKINTSPYFGKVKIVSVRPRSASRSSLITLTTQLKKEEKIKITGWRIKGKAGSFVIPGGIEKYNPYYNPVPSKSIFVKQGDKIYLSGASNPLGRGRNFRPNKCLGYFTNYRDFPIPLSRNCPILKREEISHLDPCCQEFILRMGRCGTPNYSTNFRISSDSECVSFLNKNFNYGGCFRKYSRDENFLINQWHIYLNRNIVVTNDCDTLYLRDQNGLFIDKYSYGRAICK